MHVYAMAVTKTLKDGEGTKAIIQVCVFWFCSANSVRLYTKTGRSNKRLTQETQTAQKRQRQTRGY